ncbi:MAG: AAA family ATPase, partial [Thermoplasmata archaeon]
IKELAFFLRPALENVPPGNIAIYGKPGSGKTVVTNYVLKLLNDKSKEMGMSDKLHLMYIPFSNVATEVQILQYIINAYSDKPIKLRGLGLSECYQILERILSEKKGIFIFVFDEFDKLKTDNILYNLTRMNLQVSVIGISNDIKFMERLDPRLKSSFGGNHVFFPPYNTAQLVTILEQRVKLGANPSSVPNSVISLCASIAARQDGDARKAIDLLRVSIQIAEMDGRNVVEERDVYKAQHKIEMDAIKYLITKMPIHQKVVLLAIVLNEEQGKRNITGEIYETYKELCGKLCIRVSTLPWVTATISEFNMLGIVDARIVSHGSRGRTTKVKLGVPLKETKELLLSDLDLK